MQYRNNDISPRPVRTARPTRRAVVDDSRGEVEWADEESDLDPSYDPDATDESDMSGITLGSQDTESDESDDSDVTDLSGFIVDDDCIEWYSSEDEEEEEDSD